VRDDLIVDLEAMHAAGSVIDFKSIINAELVAEPVGSLAHLCREENDEMSFVYSICEIMGHDTINVGPDNL